MSGASALNAASGRDYPERPWVGIGVVVWRQEEILLIRRRKPPRQGEWGIPGGAQTLGETIFETAMREVLEETGVTINPTGIITVVDAITPDPTGRIRYHYTLVEISAEWVRGDAVAASDAAATRWVNWEQACNLVAWEETLRVIGLAARLRRRPVTAWR